MKGRVSRRTVYGFVVASHKQSDYGHEYWEYEYEEGKVLRSKIEYMPIEKGTVEIEV